MAHTRIRKVSASTFKRQNEEWDYLNGTYPWETISYMVMERAVQVFPTGRLIEAGFVKTNHAWGDATFEAGFTPAPVVSGSCQTFKGTHVIVTRQRKVTAADSKSGC